MDLELESGRLIEGASEQAVWGCLDGEDFAILSETPGTYIQCAREADHPEAWFLEYQEGSLDHHYRALDRHIASERIRTALLKYLRGDPSWKADFSWEKIAL